MIDIVVEGKSLIIPEGTAIVMEQKNNLLNGGELGADIVWTFDVASDANADVFRGGVYVYCSGAKRFDAELRFGGVPVARGVLYMQTASKNRIGCGMIVNAIVQGWGEKRLCENDFGDDILIANSKETHQEGWLSFLEGTLEEDSVVKFMLFVSSGFVAGNDDFGCYVRDGRSVISGLENEDVAFESNSPQFRSYVNRLFVSDAGNIINAGNDDGQGLRIFNQEVGGTQAENGYAFCPALRLEWLVKRLFEAEGFSVIGNFFLDARVLNLYVQSLCCMDGDRSQYDYMSRIQIKTDSRLAYGDTVMGEHDVKFVDEFENAKSCLITHPLNAGVCRLSVAYEFPVLGIGSVTEETGMFTQSEEAYFLYIRPFSNDGTEHPLPDTVYTTNGSSLFGNLKTWDEIGVPSWVTPGEISIDVNGDAYIRNYTSAGVAQWNTTTAILNVKENEALVQLSNLHNTNLTREEIVDGVLKGAVECGMIVGSSLVPIVLTASVVKATVYSSTKTTRGNYPGTTDEIRWYVSGGRLTKMDSFEYVEDYSLQTLERPFNIFANRLHYADHVPDMSNGELMQELSKMFGLNVYVDSMQRCVEISYFKDIYESKSIDITPYVVDDRVEREDVVNKRYSVVFDTCKTQKELNVGNKMEDIACADELGVAKYYPNKTVFVKNENAYRRSTKVESEDSSEEEPGSSSVYYSWKSQYGNDASLKTGSVDVEEEDVKVGIKVPNMRIVDTAMSAEKYLQEITEGGISPLFDTEFDGKFQMVITQYRGRKTIAIKADDDGASRGIYSAQIEYANPTCYDERGNVVEGTWTLSARGENSVGEECLTDMYNMLSHNVPVRMVAYMPIDIALDVYRLNMPQRAAMKNQVRWLSYKSQRYMPTMVSYEFGSGDKVLVTIDAIRES